MNSKVLPEEVREYLKLKHRREVVRKCVKTYFEKRKSEGNPIKKPTKYYPESEKAYKYKQNALLAVKRLFGETHLI